MSKLNEPEMSAQELEAYLTSIDLTDKDFAHLMGVTENAVKFWLAGERKVPPTVARLIKLFKSDPKYIGMFQKANT